MDGAIAARHAKYDRLLERQCRHQHLLVELMSSAGRGNLAKKEDSASHRFTNCSPLTLLLTMNR